MKIITTERRYWVNGFDHRYAFWTFALSFHWFAVMLCNRGCFVTLYKLI